MATSACASCYCSQPESEKFAEVENVPVTPSGKQASISAEKEEAVEKTPQAGVSLLVDDVIVKERGQDDLAKLMEGVPQWITDQLKAQGCLARRRFRGKGQRKAQRLPTAKVQRVASVHHNSAVSTKKFHKMYRKALKHAQKDWKKLLTSAYLKIFIIGACSCALTFYFNHDLKMYSVLASSVVGVIAHSFQSPYREVAFAATFGGMGGHLDKPGGPFTLGSAAILGTVVALVYLLMEGHFNGVGGKLGTIAFISGAVCAAVGKPLGNEWKPIQEEEWTGWTFPMALGSIAAGTLGCLLTVFLMNKEKPLASTTLASSTTGLASLFLLQLHDEPLYGQMWSAFAYTGSFAGMTAKTRLMPPFVVLAGFLGSCILLLVWPLCPGVGGKYGLSALLAVLIVERLPGAQDSKYDPKTWFAEPDPDSSGGSTPAQITSSTSAKSLVSVVSSMQSLGPWQQPDWVDWVPPTAWQAVADYLASLQKKGSSPKISDARLAQRALQKHYGLHAPKVRPQDVEEVRRVLDLCCFAERRARPPPDWHADGERDPTAVFASQWFRAVAQSKKTLPAQEVLSLLEVIEAQGVGLDMEDDEEVDLGEFVRCVTTRRSRREELEEIENHVEGGHYS
mmetsp:Transcript_8896/g.14663  ORF Transcript_8896/g.14663 Transcript_8896/m.14663 type:complete len:622 (-) Transcript_8896:156-2021(-)